MLKNKRILYIAISLFLIIIIDTMVLNHLDGKQSFLQMKIESLLPKRETEEQRIEMGNVRVLIKTNGFEQIAHPEVKLSASSELSITVSSETSDVSADETSIVPAGEMVTITPSDERFEKGSIKISCVNSVDKIEIASLQRGYGIPAYRGSLELFSTAEGIVIVNELPIEQYLYAVVPSEMPASYEQEALKAQAVCARSYAYNQTRDYSYPEYKAHVDDSTSFQVYGNSREQDSTIRAVNETEGELLWYNKRVATAYYYSTSSGKSTSITAWGGEFNESNTYLKSVDLCDEKGNAYETELPWYRWTAIVSEQRMSDLIELNTETEIGTLQKLEITKEGDGGVVQEITAYGTAGKVVVATENKIRRALGGKGYQIEKQDGTMVDSTTLLPSAFFSISKSGGNYVINGGGYGHGIGMSQNGANEMAKTGKTYLEILKTFYTGIEIKKAS